MQGQRLGTVHGRWLALAPLFLLGGCVGALALPLIAGGALTARSKAHVRAATPVPKQAGARLTTLKELPPPSAVPTAADDPWQKFIAYALAQKQPASPDAGAGPSALLKDDPSLETPERRDCLAPVPAVVIDLDDDAAAFDPHRLISAPPALTQGLTQLREAGIAVLWISQLPAARAGEVAQALRSSRLDPGGQDQLLLIRSAKDRKQLLRANANDDVCIVAIAGDRRSDFDELFDYLRDPDGAFGLDKMIGEGWFLVPPLAAPAP